MAAISMDNLGDAASRSQVLERAICLTLSEDSVRIKFPTTRRLAEFMGVPHYYVLPYFAQMEEQDLITRAERVGILTTPKGSRKMLALVREKYAGEMKKILGPDLFPVLTRED